MGDFFEANAPNPLHSNVMKRILAIILKTKLRGKEVK